MAHTPTDGRVSCKAIVTVTLELEIGPQWKSHDLENIYRQAARDAMEQVTTACRAFAVVKGPVTVRSILTVQMEPAP